MAVVAFDSLEEVIEELFEFAFATGTQCQDPLGQPLQERTSTSVATTRRTGTTATCCQRQTLSKCIHGPMLLLLARGIFVLFDPSATWSDVSLLLSGISGGSRFHVTQKRDRAKEGRN